MEFGAIGGLFLCHFNYLNVSLIFFHMYTISDKLNINLRFFFQFLSRFNFLCDFLHLTCNMLDYNAMDIHSV